MERKKIWSDVIFRCAMSMLSGFSAVITVAICLKIDFMAVVVKDNSAIFLIIGYINAKILYGAVKKGHIKASEIGDDFFNLKSKTLFYEPFFFSIPLIIFFVAYSRGKRIYRQRKLLGYRFFSRPNNILPSSKGSSSNKIVFY